MGKAKKNPGKSFMHSHALTYGLKVMEHCRDSLQVMSVRCQFCVYFGYEIDPNAPPRQRAVKKTQMGWTGPLFKTDAYTDHHERMHRSVWTQYQASSSLDKSHFFDGITPFANTLLAHIETSLVAPVLKYMIRAPIVDVIIGDMFFHPDDQGGTAQTTALKLFKRIADQLYEVTIANPTQFRLVIEWVAAGVSFRQCAAILASTKAVLRITTFSYFLIQRIALPRKPQRHDSCRLHEDCHGTQSRSYLNDP